MELFDPDDIDEAQADAESVMFDVCTIDRPGATVTDADGVVSTEMTPVYPTAAELAAGNPGKFKVQQTISQASNPETAGHLYTIQDARLDLPVSAGPLQVGDLITVHSSLKSPHMVGNLYTLDEIYEKSYTSAQRVRVKQVTA